MADDDDGVAGALAFIGSMIVGYGVWKLLTERQCFHCGKMTPKTDLTCKHCGW